MTKINFFKKYWLLGLILIAFIYFRKSINKSITTFFNPLAADQQNKLAEDLNAEMQNQYPSNLQDAEIAQQIANLMDKVIIFDSDEDQIFTLINNNLSRKNYIKSAYGVRNLKNRKFFTPDNKNLLEAITSYFDTSRDQTKSLIHLLNN